MEIHISKWGNSLALRIPLNIVKDLNFVDGTKADIMSDGKQIVITPIKPKKKRKSKKYNLAELVSGITENNRHREIDDGRPIGNEEL